MATDWSVGRPDLGGLVGPLPLLGQRCMQLPMLQERRLAIAEILIV